MFSKILLILASVFFVNLALADNGITVTNQTDSTITYTIGNADSLLTVPPHTVGTLPFSVIDNWCAAYSECIVELIAVNKNNITEGLDMFSIFPKTNQVVDVTPQNPPSYLVINVQDPLTNIFIRPAKAPKDQ